MQQNKKYRLNLLPFLLLSFIIGIGACNSKRANNGLPAEKETLYTDSTRIIIQPSELDTVRVIFTDNETLNTYINEEDWPSLTDRLYTARYDTVWNESDIMVKMIAPDYMLELHYKSNAEMEFVFMWIDSGRVKFRNKWFLLDEVNGAPIYGLLNTYRDHRE